MPTFSSPRFSGNVTLEQCLNGSRTMPPQNGALPEPDTAATKIVQRALVDLGYLRDYGDADGKFGTQTADAVHRFKADRGISPSDGVVGPRTSAALDQVFPPAVMSTGPFSPFLAAGPTPRLDATIAGLATELQSMTGPFAANAGAFALQELTNNNLAGIVRASRISDLNAFLPSSEQANALATATSVNGSIGTGARTNSFDQAGWNRGYIIVNDSLLDRAGAGDERHVPMLMILAHELLHFRNRLLFNVLMTEPVDPTNYVDPGLASNPMFGPPQLMRSTFISEIAARHTGWKVYLDIVGQIANDQLAAGIINSPAAVAALTAPLTVGHMFRSASVLANGLEQDTGYLLNLQDAPRNQQAANWMRSAQRFAFHDVQALDNSMKGEFETEFVAAAPSFTPDVSLAPQGLPTF